MQTALPDDVDLTWTCPDGHPHDYEHPGFGDVGAPDGVCVHCGARQSDEYAPDPY